MAANPTQTMRRVYVRFHKQLDEALNVASEATGMPRATLVTWIIETHLQRLDEQHPSQAMLPSPDFTGAPTDPETRLALHPASGVYALKIGRTAKHAPRSIGKLILLTIPAAQESRLRLLAEVNEISVNHLRSAIVATFLLENGMLRDAQA